MRTFQFVSVSVTARQVFKRSADDSVLSAVHSRMAEQTTQEVTEDIDELRSDIKRNGVSLREPHTEGPLREVTCPRRRSLWRQR